MSEPQPVNLEPGNSEPDSEATPTPSPVTELNSPLPSSITMPVKRSKRPYIILGTIFLLAIIILGYWYTSS